MDKAASIKKFASLPWIAEITALMGGFVNLSQALKFAHTQVSILDGGGLHV